MQDQPHSTTEKADSDRHLEKRGLLSRLRSVFVKEPITREEFTEALHRAYGQKLFDAEALTMMEGALEVGELSAVDLMVPRAQIEAIDIKEPREVWGVEQYTRSVEAFARENGIRRPILIGHSFGGRVAILYASRNDVEKVMLVDAAGVKPRRSARYYWKVYSYKVAKRLLPIAVGKPRAQRMIERYRAKTGSSDYNNATPMMRAILSKCVNEDLCHVMPQIKAPTLLFWGERDTATPVADARRMESLIPDAGVVIVKGGSHFSFLDNPDLFLRVAESFLIDHGAKDAAATAEPNKTE